MKNHIEQLAMVTVGYRKIEINIIECLRTYSPLNQVKAYQGTHFPELQQSKINCGRSSTGLQIRNKNFGVSHFSDNKSIALFEQIDKMISRGEKLTFL